MRRPDTEPTSDFSDFANDPVFLEMMSGPVYRLENILEEVDVVEASIDDILEMIEAIQDPD